MSLEDLRKKTEKGLTTNLQKSKEQLAKLYFKLEKEELVDYSQVEKKRREIAQISTILNEKKNG